MLVGWAVQLARKEGTPVLLPYASQSSNVRRQRGMRAVVGRGRNREPILSLAMKRSLVPEVEIKPVPAEASADPGLLGKQAWMAGIGGCGMSGLARLLRTHGAIVSGSDLNSTETTRALQQDGFTVEAEGGLASLPETCDMLVISAAVSHSHPLVLSASERGIPVHTYAEMLGRLMRACTGVAIAGTHGKSTTTAMLGSLLVDCGFDPSVIVGATCPTLGGGSLGSPVFSESVGYRVGGRRCIKGVYEGRPGLLVAEACEFNRSFHNLRPTVAAITSVEADHLDVYGSLEAVVRAFAEFAQLLPPAEEGGLLIIGHENAERRTVTAGLRCRVETIGFNPGADWVVGYSAREHVATLSKDGKEVGRWATRTPGQHNALNAATALALAIGMGADPAMGARSLGAFRGVDRRTQLLGERRVPGGAVRVYDDYGHHPTEVDSTLRALRDFERPQERGGRLICVFQPHQHSRTRFLLDEFAQAFSQADIVIVPHIYFVRDSQAEKTKVTEAELVDRLRQRGVRAMHLYPFEAIVEQLENTCRANDMLVVMGAGPVNKVAHGYMEAGKAVEAR